MSTAQLLLTFAWFVSLFLSLAVSLFKVNFGNGCAYAIAFISFMFAGFRPDSFPDYNEYIQIIKSAKTGNFMDPFYWASHGEPGFKILIYSLSYIDDANVFIFVAISMLTYFSLVLLTRTLSLNFAVVWFFYLSFFFITRDLGQVRLSIASTLVVYAITHESFKRSMLIGVLSSICFQYLSVVAIVVIKALKHIKFDHKIAAILFAFSVILGFIINFDIISSNINFKLVDNYYGTVYVESDESSALLPIIRNAALFFIIYIFLRKNITLKLANVYVWSSFMCLLSYISFAQIPIVSQRISAYFIAVTPFAYALFLMHRSNRMIKQIATYGSATAVFLMTLVGSSYLR